MIDSAPTPLPALPGMPAPATTAASDGASGASTDGAAPLAFAQVLAQMRLATETEGQELLDLAVADGEGEGDGNTGSDGEEGGEGVSGPGVQAPMPMATVQTQGSVLVSALDVAIAGDEPQTPAPDLVAVVADVTRGDAGTIGEPTQTLEGLAAMAAGRPSAPGELAGPMDGGATTVDGDPTAPAVRTVPVDDGPDAVDVRSDAARSAALVLDAEPEQSEAPRLEVRDTDGGRPEVEGDAVAGPTDRADASPEGGAGDERPGAMDLPDIDVGEGGAGDEGPGAMDLADLEVPETLPEEAATSRSPADVDVAELADADVQLPAGRVESARTAAAEPAGPTTSGDRAQPTAVPAPVATPVATASATPASNQSTPALFDRVALRDMPSVVVDRVRVLDPTGGMNRAVVRLDPPDLGQIVVEVVGLGDEIAVVARADTAEAAKALMRQRADIQLAVEALGLSVTDFDVQHDDGDSGQAQQGRDQRPNRSGPDVGSGGYQTVDLPEPEGELFL